MSLSEELHNILTTFREHVASWVNSGQLLTIDGHLDRLAAAAQSGIQAADDEAKVVLAELYTALHGAPPPAPAEQTPAEPTAPAEPSQPADTGWQAAPASEPPVEAEPAPEATAEPAPAEETPDAAAQ